MYDSEIYSKHLEHLLETSNNCSETTFTQTPDKKIYKLVNDELNTHYREQLVI
jgi:hypothetical protein